MIEADVGARLFEGLFATDAMGSNDVDNGGYAIVHATVPLEQVEDVFSVSQIKGYSVGTLDGDRSGFRDPDRQRASGPRPGYPPVCWSRCGDGMSF